MVNKVISRHSRLNFFCDHPCCIFLILVLCFGMYMYVKYEQLKYLMWQHGQVVNVSD